MIITEVHHKDVALDGKVKSGGAVETIPIIRFSTGGCGLEGCHCSDDAFLYISAGRDKSGNVKGLSVIFDSIQEMKELMSDGVHELRGRLRQG